MTVGEFWGDLFNSQRIFHSLGLKGSFKSRRNWDTKEINTLNRLSLSLQPCSAKLC